MALILPLKTLLWLRAQEEEEEEKEEEEEEEEEEVGAAAVTPVRGSRRSSVHLLLHTEVHKVHTYTNSVVHLC